MKKATIITVFLTVFVFSSVFAQDDEKTVSGIRGGFQSATLVMDGATPYDANNLESFYVGFFNDNKIVPLLYFGKGLEYFQNGLKYTNDSKRILHTISVPLYLKLKIGPVYGLGGIAGNIKVSEKYPTESEKSKWFDAPLFLGAGVKILFVSVEARYHWGLLEVTDGLHSRYLQVGAAISF